MKPLSAPSPNLGDCSVRDKWEDSSFVNQCKNCITDPDMFFCNGECMSKYDTNSVCPKDFLVAKTSDQCEMPCVQTDFPPANGGCSDKFDCDWKRGEICVIKDARGTCKTIGLPSDSKTFAAKNCTNNNDCVQVNHETCVISNGVGMCKTETHLSSHIDMIIAMTIIIMLTVLIFVIISSARKSIHK
jgi:hypothetical protein